MKRIANKEIKDYIKNLLEFDNNLKTCYARYINHNGAKCWIYAVYSYRDNYPIAVNISGKWFKMTEEKPFSLTTARHIKSLGIWGDYEGCTVKQLRTLLCQYD